MAVGFLYLLVVLLGLQGSEGSTRSNPEVTTRLGVIRGLLSESGGVSRFLGVPYALVDEANPFSPAIPHPGFTEPFDAHSDSIICPQVKDGRGVGEIQCLQLQIYVPNTSTQNKTVMLWIHGGAFVEGNGGSEHFAPTYLVNKDVIFVSINYRLGIYGFLCLDTPEFPGNQGLKDQLLALKWVKEHIEAFGGDPNKITLFGESAGGMSVNVHLINNKEKLFNNAIVQSGPAMTTRMLVRSNRVIPVTIAAELGYNTDSYSKAVEFLETQNAASVVERSFIYRIQPCIEKKFEGVDSFLVDYPLNIESELVKSVPVMIGFNDNEFAFQYGFLGAEFFENYSFDSFLDFGMERLNTSVVDILRRFYIGDEPLGYDVRTQITDFASDFSFSYPSERMIKRFMEQDAVAIYYYVFSYDGERNFLKKLFNLQVEGAAHADELGYLFDMQMFLDAKNERDMLMVERMTTLWTNFAKYGTPTPSSTELLPFIWPTVTKETRPYLSLDTELTIKSRPFNKRFAFWDLFYKLNEQYEFGYGYEPQYGEDGGNDANDDGNDSVSLRGSLINLCIILCIMLYINL